MFGRCFSSAIARRVQLHAVAGRGGRHFTDPEDLKMPDRMLQFFGFDHLPDNLKSSRGRSASWRMTSSRSFR